MFFLSWALLASSLAVIRPVSSALYTDSADLGAAEYDYVVIGGELVLRISLGAADFSFLLFCSWGRRECRREPPFRRARQQGFAN